MRLHLLEDRIDDGFDRKVDADGRLRMAEDEMTTGPKVAA
jgi:hypothetical protein